jgi:hypothetical protein
VAVAALTAGLVCRLYEPQRSDVRLCPSRYRQHFRSPPFDTGMRQRLEAEERGGFSFGQPSDFDEDLAISAPSPSALAYERLNDALVAEFR